MVASLISNINSTASVSSGGGSALDLFALKTANTPFRSITRLGIILLQAGMALMVLTLCVSIAAMNIGMVIAGVGALLARAPLHRCVGFWPGVAFAIWQVMARSIQDGDFHTLQACYLWLGLPLAQIAFHGLIPGAKEFRMWVMRGLIFTMCASAVTSLGQYFLGRGDTRPFRIDIAGPHYSFTSGFFSIHLTQGIVLALLFFLIAGLRIWMTKPWILIANCAAVLAVVLSGARSAILGFCSGIIMWLVTRGKRQLVASVVGSVAVIIGFVGILYLTQPQRLQTMLAMQDGRWPIWRTTAHVIAEHPWLGLGGANAYKKAYAAAYPTINPSIPNEFPQEVPHAHNTLLNMAAEDGVPLAVLWLGLLGSVAIALRHASPEVRRSGYGMITLVAVFSQFERLDGESSRVLWTSLGMLLATIGGTATKASNEDSTTSAPDLNMHPSPSAPLVPYAPG